MGIARRNSPYHDLPIKKNFGIAIPAGDQVVIVVET
jgi:hypothetical protein